MRRPILEFKPIQLALWVVRAGKKGAAHELFLGHNIIVLADAGLGDLRKLPAKRQAFYKEYHKKHPEETRTAISGIGGKFFRFVHEVQIGDLVLYPSLKDKQIYIGKIVSEYTYSLVPDSKFPHHREVQWRYIASKTALSETAKRELGAARTFFKYKTHAEEIQAMITEEGVQKYRTVERKNDG